MIAQLATVPILVVTMDPTFDQEALLRSISDPLAAADQTGGAPVGDATGDYGPNVEQPPGPLTDAAKRAVNGISAYNAITDVVKRERSIPIPITDMLWDIHYVGGTASSFNEVTPMDLPQLVVDTQREADIEDATKKIITVGRQNVTLTFRAKSEVIALSSIRDVLDSIGMYQPMLKGAVTHISFFSSTLCVKDAILVGYGKSYDAETSMGAISLTLELVNEIKVKGAFEGDYWEGTDPTNPEYEFENDKKKHGPNGEVKKPGDELAVPPTPTMQMEVAMRVLKHADVYKDYVWYIVADTEKLQNIPVPAYSDEGTIRLNKYTLYRCISRDAQGNPRDLQGVKWLDRNISLESNLGGKFWKDIAICRVREEEKNPLNTNILILFGVKS